MATLPFITGQPVQVRLSQATASALNAAGDIELHSAVLMDGWLVASYREPGGGITKYLLPPGSFLYVRQFQPDPGATPPGQQ